MMLLENIEKDVWFYTHLSSALCILPSALMITEPKVLSENIYKIKTAHIIFPFSRLSCSSAVRDHRWPTTSASSWRRFNIWSKIYYFCYTSASIIRLWFLIVLIIELFRSSSFPRQLWRRAVRVNSSRAQSKHAEWHHG